jgi:hypothetical protein
VLLPIWIPCRFGSPADRYALKHYQRQHDPQHESPKYGPRHAGLIGAQIFCLLVALHLRCPTASTQRTKNTRRALRKSSQAANYGNQTRGLALTLVGVQANSNGMRGDAWQLIAASTSGRATFPIRKNKKRVKQNLDRSIAELRKRLRCDHYLKNIKTKFIMSEFIMVLYGGSHSRSGYSHKSRKCRGQVYVPSVSHDSL